MIPHATGAPQRWPVDARERWSPGSFGSPRGQRKHAGVDVKAPPGTLVIATEPGTVTRVQSFDPRKDRPADEWSRAVIVELDSGGALVFGELANPVDVQAGDRVQAGTVLGRVDRYGMLHFETRTAGLRAYTKRQQWWPPATPPDLLDPRDYLERAAAAQRGAPQAPRRPRVPPRPRKPAPASGGGGGLVLALPLLFLLAGGFRR